MGVKCGSGKSELVMVMAPEEKRRMERDEERGEEWDEGEKSVAGE